MKEKIGRATRVIGASRKLRKIIARELVVTISTKPKSLMRP